MEQTKKERLEAAGFKVGTPAQFLGMTPEQAAVARIKNALRRILRQTREERGITQAEMGEQMGIKQEAVARLESSQGSVSIDNLVKAIVMAGISEVEIGKALASTHYGIAEEAKPTKSIRVHSPTIEPGKPLVKASRKSNSTRKAVTA